MAYPPGRQYAVTTSDDSRTKAWASQAEGKCSPPDTRGTWLDSPSSTCTGTSVRESGLPSFEPRTSSGSDTSSTQPILPLTKTTRQRPNGNRIIGKHGRVWKEKRLERNAMRRLQEQFHWLSDRLDANYWNVSKLQMEVYRLRGELRVWKCDAKTVSRAGEECVDDADVDAEKAELPHWRDAD